MKLKTLALLSAGAYALYRLTQNTSTPPGVHALPHFDWPAHLGRWYEIARIDHAYETGLTDTSLELHAAACGQLRVLKRGHQARRWHEARGNARLAPDGSAQLHLSYMWPVRASHIIFYTDANHQHALACGHNHDYLWLLARHPSIKPATRADLLKRARAAGFDTERLHWVDQRRNLAAEG